MDRVLCQAGLRQGNFVVAGLVLTVFLAGCGPKPEPKKPAPIVYDIAKPLTMEVVEWDRYQGRFEAVNEVDIRARVSGYLSEIHFEDGKDVKIGDRLFTIDQEPFRADLDRAKAELTTAQAGVREAEAKLNVAKVAKTEVSGGLQLAQANLRRAQGLRGTGGISQEAIEIRDNEVFQAEARVASAEANIVAATAAVDTAHAAVSSAQAGVKIQDLNLKFTSVESPIDGQVSRREVSVGDLIVGGPMGATLLTTVVSSDPIYFYFTANQAEYLRYDRLARSGDRASSRTVHHEVYLRLDDESSYPHKGHMDFVDTRLDNATATIRGRAIFRNDGRFRPGVFARLRLPGSNPHNVILIPDSAVIVDQTNQVVNIVGAENKVERRPIVTGELSHGLRIIRSGLTGDEMVVLTGANRLAVGSPLEVKDKDGYVTQTTKVVPVTAESSDLPDHTDPLSDADFLALYGRPAGLPDNSQPGGSEGNFPTLPAQKPSTQSEPTPPLAAQPSTPSSSEGMAKDHPAAGPTSPAAADTTDPAVAPASTTSVPATPPASPSS